MGKGESKLIHMIPKDFLKSYEEEYKILGLTRNDICLLHNIFREIQQYRLHNRNPQQPPQSSPHHFEQLSPGRQINEEKEEDDDALIKLEKLLGYFSIEKTSFTKLLFMSFDIDLFVLDHIDFPRFVQAVWNFCSLDDEALSKFLLNTCQPFPLSTPLPILLSSNACLNHPRRLLCLQSLRHPKR
jgi:hypothetical protein